MGRDVAIITLHRVLNYGSVLQTFALSKAVEQLGHRARVIDYITGTHKFGYVVSHGKAHHPTPLRQLLVLAILPKFLMSRWRFDAFIARHLKLTRRCESVEELQAQPPDADVYVTGSDQVWNSVYNAGVDPSFFLAFGSPHVRRIAYAASFGRAELDADEIPRTRQLLAAYQAIAVRESSALPLLERMGISGASHVLDPTLLLTRAQWEQFMPSARGEGERYILVHGVNKESQDDLVAYARRLQAATGFKLLTTLAFNADLAGRASGAVFGWHRRTEDFLALIRNASYVVTDSFHATVFSITFNRQFLSLLPAKYNTRLTSLLQLLGIPERAAQAGVDLARIEAPIDYAEVNARLAAEREKSLAYLAAAIAG